MNVDNASSSRALGALEAESQPARADNKSPVQSVDTMDDKNNESQRTEEVNASVTVKEPSAGLYSANNPSLNKANCLFIVRCTTYSDNLVWRR